MQPRASYEHAAATFASTKDFYPAAAATDLLVRHSDAAAATWEALADDPAEALTDSPVPACVCRHREAKYPTRDRRLLVISHLLLLMQPAMALSHSKRPCIRLCLSKALVLHGGLQRQPGLHTCGQRLRNTVSDISGAINTPALLADKQQPAKESKDQMAAVATIWCEHAS